MAEVDPQLKRALMMGLLADTLCIGVGVLAFLATKNWVFLVGGVLLGSGFLLPPLIKIIRAQR